MLQKSIVGCHHIRDLDTFSAHFSSNFLLISYHKLSDLQQTFKVTKTAFLMTDTGSFINEIYTYHILNIKPRNIRMTL